MELGHDGCPGMTVAKRFIRTRLWFPDMDDRVERRVGARDGAGHRPPWEVNLAAFDGIFSRQAHLERR